MKKLAAQVILLVGFFLGSWLVIYQVDWMHLFNVEQINKKTEEKLGNLFWDFFNHSQKEIQDMAVLIPIDSILNRICLANEIDTSQIKIHIFKNDEINAFALPNKHLVIYTQLILTTENEAELSGVICHELAHMEMNHVMKKLIKEVGLSALISITTGNNSAEIVKETAKLLSSTAYDRSLEREADTKAVDYLSKAQIDPEPFANFLYKLAINESKNETLLIWMSTHPDSKERAEFVIEYSKGMPKNFRPILVQTSWDTLQKTLREWK
ncbi:MAG: M48 family metallopeptidase [Salinivirgaceae bacterium]|jgi:predicted Zn-dependent protease